MPIQNLTGLEKPLEKLVETISEGVGVVGNSIFQFDAAKIKRIGSAEAEIEKEKIIARAEGQEEAIEILGRAEKRFALEQYNKQINLENIIVKTKEDLEGKTVSEEPVEKDWTMRFLDIAQNVSREEVQNVLAGILSGEVQKPGTYSYQTLEVVKYLSKKDLESFLKFVAISTYDGVIKLGVDPKASLQKYDLRFDEYLNLSTIGLFSQSSTLRFDIELQPLKSLRIDVGLDFFDILSKDEATKEFNLGLFVFSNTGRELRSLLLKDAHNDKADLFKDDFVKKVKEMGLEIIKK